MSKWLDQFLDKKPQNEPDKTDTSQIRIFLSGLSGPHVGHFDENSGNEVGILTDKTDKSQNGGYLSGLSVPSCGISEKIRYYSFGDFEERLAIVQYDGQYNTSQAHRIAYLDAFVSALTSLPYQEILEDPGNDWLENRIKAAKQWLYQL